MQAATRAGPGPAPAPFDAVTLWDVYTRHGGRADAPLAAALLSDANVELLTRVLRAKAVAQLGPLAPPPASLSIDACDAFSTALITGAIDHGWLAVNSRTLETTNRKILDAALKRLSIEQSTWHRWRTFAETGPQLEPRPETDHERADRKELQRPGLGKGLFNPWESYGEARGLVDTYQPFNGLSVREISDADDMRVQVVPWAPAAVHGQIPPFAKR